MKKNIACISRLSDVNEQFYTRDFKENERYRLTTGNHHKDLKLNDFEITRYGTTRSCSGKKECIANVTSKQIYNFFKEKLRNICED